MRKITIAGKEYDVRGLKRKEIKEKLTAFGFRTTSWNPPKNADGGTDLDLMDAGQDAVLQTVLGADLVDEIDGAGGNNALSDAFLAIIKETYGARDEEKNLSPPGGGSQTLSK